MGSQTFFFMPVEMMETLHSSKLEPTQKFHSTIIFVYGIISTIDISIIYPDISSIKRAASHSISCLCRDKGARSVRRSCCCCVYDWTIALRGTNWLGASISTSTCISSTQYKDIKSIISTYYVDNFSTF